MKYFCREVLPTSLKVFLSRSRSIFEGIVEEFSINHNERRALWSLNWAMALALHQVKISCAQVTFTNIFLDINAKDTVNILIWIGRT